jgi:tetratricopeptide (TPR) repeat protein
MIDKFNYLFKKEFLKGKYYLLFLYLIIIFSVLSFSFISPNVYASNLDVGVLYFNNQTKQPSWDWLSKGLTDMLIDDLSQFDSSINCCPRQDIENIYLKLNIVSNQVEIDKSLLNQINKNLKAKIIFFGDYYFSSPSNLNLSLKKYEVSSGEITTFRDFIVKRTDIFKLKQKIIFFILNELNIEVSSQDEAIIKEISTSSIEALINYYKCLDLKDKAITKYKGVDFPSKELWAEAINYGEKAVKIDPKFAEAYYLLAEIYNRTHWSIREVESLNHFMKLIESKELKNKGIYDKVSKAYFKLGYAFYSKKEFEQAIEYFNSSIKYNPDLLESHFYLVQVYYDIGKIGLSLDECEEVLRIDPQNKEIVWFIKKNEQAKKYGRKAYENYEKGYLAYKNNNYAEAINYFKSSILNNSEYKDSHYYLALSYYNIGDFDNSITQWNEVIKIDPFDNSAKRFLNKSLEEKKYGRDTLRYFNIGYDYYIKGEYEKAIEEFKKSLSCNPKFEKAQKYLSRSYYQLNQMDKYREEIEKATRLKVINDEEKVEEHYKLGYEFYSLKKYQVAIEELKKALNLKNDYPAARYLLAECYFKQKEYKIALVEYDRVVSDSAKNEYTDDSLLGSGWCYYLLEKYEEADKRFSKLLMDFPQSDLALQAYYKLGKSNFKRENYQKVIEVYKEFIKKYPQYKGEEIEEIYFLLGQSYLWLKKYKEAEESFEKLILLYPQSGIIFQAKYYKSLCLFNQDKYEETIENLEELISEEEGRVDNKQRAEAQYLLSRCWINLREYNKASKELEDLKQYKTSNPLIFEKSIFDLGLTYSIQGDKEKAILKFQEFIEKYPKSKLIESAHFKLSECLFDLKKYKLVLNELEGISTVDALYLKIKTFEQLGDQEGEIFALEELIKRYPKNEFSQEAYFKLGNYYYNQKKYKEAVGEFSKVIEFFPSSDFITESYYWIGWSYFKLADYQKANEYFKRVEERGKNLGLRQKAQFMAAESLYNLKDYSKAREEYENFIQEYPQSELAANAQYAIAWSFLENKDIEDSIREFKKITQFYPDCKYIEESQFIIGKSYFLLGEKDKAEVELEKFADKHKESEFREEALYLLSQRYLEEEKWIDTIIRLERLIREYPHTRYLSQALYGLCLSYFKKDEYEKAIKEGEKYLKDFGDLQFVADVLYIKAVCWEKLKNQEKAISDYQNLISKFPKSSYIEKTKERLKILQKESE